MIILTVQGKITIFKNVAISKITHLALVTNFPQVIIDQLNKIQTDFIQNRKHPKIRHSTLCNTHKNGGLKRVHIPNKLTSLQCSWIKGLYTTTHCWTIVPAFLIRKKIGKNFIFHSNLSINSNKIKEFPTYYQDILIKWEKHFSSSPSLLHLLFSNVYGIMKILKQMIKLFLASLYLLKELTLQDSTFKTINKLKNGMNSKQDLI